MNNMIVPKIAKSHCNVCNQSGQCSCNKMEKKLTTFENFNVTMTIPEKKEEEKCVKHGINTPKLTYSIGKKPKQPMDPFHSVCTPQPTISNYCNSCCGNCGNLYKTCTCAWDGGWAGRRGLPGPKGETGDKGPAGDTGDAPLWNNISLGGNRGTLTPNVGGDTLTIDAKNGLVLTKDSTRKFTLTIAGTGDERVGPVSYTNLTLPTNHYL